MPWNQYRTRSAETDDRFYRNLRTVAHPILLRMHGTEIERPLAIVMTGGLVTSTIFILLVLPTIYPWFVRRTGGEHAQ